ncbi:MAG: hypothetical protein K2M73_07660 [Lachnospiraceae bacterium]|nr:hypothetical protein [Lachnospiraceae bacterium]
MNIAFWSSVSGKSATSGNMIAVGTMASLVYSLKTLFVQYDYLSKPIEEVFEGKKNSDIIRDEMSYYRREGIDEILSRLKLKKLNEQFIFSNIKNIRNTHIYYLPSSRKVRNGIDEESAEYLSASLPKTLNKISDINLIDNQNGNRRLSKKSLRDSDVVVINLYQGIEDIEQILEDENIRRKAVFLVGKYDEASKESLNIIRKKYNIEKDEIGVIPYNIHFHDAINEGKVVEFISKSMYSKRNDSDFEFINELYKSTNLILKKAGFNEVS